MDIIKIAKKICNIASTFLLVLVIIMVVLLVGVRLIGLSPYIVLSGSMEPEYHVGSIIYLSDISSDELEVGDSITYNLSDITVTHRIVEINSDPTHGVTFKTQGDANNTVDGYDVRPSQILGKPLFTIPLLGYVANFVQNPPGLYIVLGVCILLITYLVFSDVIFPDKNHSSQEESS